MYNTHILAPKQFNRHENPYPFTLDTMGNWHIQGHSAKSYLQYINVLYVINCLEILLFKTCGYLHYTKTIQNCDEKSFCTYFLIFPIILIWVYIYDFSCWPFVFIWIFRCTILERNILHIRDQTYTKLNVWMFVSFITCNFIKKDHEANLLTIESTLKAKSVSWGWIEYLYSISLPCT